MTGDPKAIKDTIARWLKASKAGDMKTLASILADDVVFQTIGRPAFGKKEFFALGGGKPASFRSKLKVDEVVVQGDFAYTRIRLEIAVVPAKGHPEMRMAGPILSIWRRAGGRWLLARDANFVAPSK